MGTGKHWPRQLTRAILVTKVSKDGEEQCMHLKKNLYGMVDAARNWFHCLEQWLLKECPLSFTQLGSDQCTFYCQEEAEFLILFLYVDDVICIASDVKLKDKLFK